MSLFCFSQTHSPISFPTGNSCRVLFSGSQVAFSTSCLLSVPLVTDFEYRAGSSSCLGCLSEKFMSPFGGA